MASPSLADAPSPAADVSELLNTSAPAAPISASSEPQWMINRRANKSDSGLLRLPNEILVEIMIFTSVDRVSLYMIRQVCHCFADLFSCATFKAFHERGFSLILGRNKQRVELESMPLTAFWARLIDVAFSSHTERARCILMRDCGPQLVETKCPETGEVLLEEEDLTEMKLCDYCRIYPRPKDNMHEAKSFPPSQRGLSDDERACEKWFGNINLCSHCDYHGGNIQTDRDNYCDMVEYRTDRRGRGDISTECSFECETCFKDLCPEGVDLEEAYPAAKPPRVLWTEMGDSTYQQYSVAQEWVMPLLGKADGSSPHIITRSTMHQRLRELSEGPYEDLLQMSLGPFASFRDEAFLEAFGEDIDTSKRWDTLLQLDGKPNFEDCDRSTEVRLFLEDDCIYLSFEKDIWWMSQEFNRDTGWGECSDYYYDSDDEEETE